MPIASGCLLDSWLRHSNAFTMNTSHQTSIAPRHLSSRWGGLALLLCVGCSSAEGAPYSLPGSGGGSGGSGGLPASVAGAGGSVAGGTGSLPQAGSAGAPASSGGVGTGGVGSGGVGAGGVGAGGVGAGGGGAAGSAGSGGSGGVLPHDGPSLYLVHCQMCHGEQGAGTLLAPETQHPVRDYSTWVVRHGRPVTTFEKPMEIIAPDKLPDADLNLIWDYLDLPPQPTTGQALYLDYCGNCHGADGQGGPTMRPILNELAELKDLVRDGAHLGEFEMRREYMPALPTTRLSDAELQLIYDYVDSL